MKRTIASVAQHTRKRTRTATEQAPTKVDSGVARKCVEDLVGELGVVLREHSVPADAAAMAKYMRNKFTFHGVKTPLRRTLLKSVLAQPLAVGVDGIAVQLALRLMEERERELHACAVDIATLYHTK